MTQYKFTVNGTSLTAALGWNTNNTLQTENITDGFNSADTQNCSYVYDDITRLANRSIFPMDRSLLVLSAAERSPAPHPLMLLPADPVIPSLAYPLFAFPYPLAPL